jgi:hypothetical protein
MKRVAFRATNGLPEKSIKTDGRSGRTHPYPAARKSVHPAWMVSPGTLFALLRWKGTKKVAFAFNLSTREETKRNFLAPCEWTWHTFLMSM